MIHRFSLPRSSNGSGISRVLNPGICHHLVAPHCTISGIAVFFVTDDYTFYI